jgi:hypothetical protein
MEVFRALEIETGGDSSIAFRCIIWFSTWMLLFRALRSNTLIGIHIGNDDGIQCFLSKYIPDGDVGFQIKVR